MRKISLTQGKEALVDDQDYDWLNQWKWYFEKRPNTGYARRTIRENGNKSYVYMHRMIMSASLGAQVDHINGNGLDNQRINLRTCSQSGNQRNRQKNIRSISQYKGVSPLSGKWRAQIRYDGKKHHLGLFDTEILAAQAYNDAALKHHGKYAKLNIPEE